MRLIYQWAFILFFAAIAFTLASAVPLFYVYTSQPVAENLGGFVMGIIAGAAGFLFAVFVARRHGIIRIVLSGGLLLATFLIPLGRNNFDGVIAMIGSMLIILLWKRAQGWLSYDSVVLLTAVVFLIYGKIISGIFALEMSKLAISGILAIIAVADYLGVSSGLIPNLANRSE